jgi:DNA-directed RNA polymerase specialized sigma24 family protein
VQSDAAVRRGNGRLQATTTRWSLILNQGVADERHSTRDALAQLCRIYWRPIFTFICHRGYAVPDAQDLTQDFFVIILKGKLLASADPSRGRFRCFLLKSLKNFLIDAEIKRHRHKRGGNLEFISWEEWMEEAPSQLVLSACALESSPGETLFDLRWAATVAEQALRRLREECESRGHRRTYEALSNYLTAARTEISYDYLSVVLGRPKAVVSRLMHEFRVRYRTLLREEVAETVEDGADIDDEIKYLCTVLSAIPR